VFSRGSPREHTFTDQAHAHILTDDDEYLANLVAAVCCVTAALVVGRH
jgi:hypothetical protein